MPSDFWQGLIDLAVDAPETPPAPTLPPELSPFQRWTERIRLLAREARDAKAAPPPDPVPATVERWAVGHAHHGFGHGNSYGGNHVVVLHHLLTGRLARLPGDALCKPAVKFWTWELIESADSGDTVNCARCAALAERFGLDLTCPSDPQESPT